MLEKLNLEKLQVHDWLAIVAYICLIVSCVFLAIASALLGDVLLGTVFLLFSMLCAGLIGYIYNVAQSR